MEYTVEERKNRDGSTYWIAIDSTRSYLLDVRGQWVSLYSVDSDHARFETREELEAAIALLPPGD